MGIPNPSQQCRQLFGGSHFLTEESQEAIISGEAFRSHPDWKLKIRKHTAISHEVSHEVLGKADNKMQSHLELLQAKGTSTWLTSLPSKQQGMYFITEVFKDAIHLRYGWVFEDFPRLCECRKENSNDL